jgi:hypothetical protein
LRLAAHRALSCASPHIVAFLALPPIPHAFTI